MTGAAGTTPTDASRQARRLLWLDRDLVESLLDPDEVLALVEESFRALDEGRARSLPVVREPLGDGNWFGLRGAWWPAGDVVGIKASGFFPGNRRRGMDSHQASILLLDSRDGRILAVVDGNHITHARTAAAGALASRTLAMPDARRVLVLGAGTQAESQVESHAHVLAERDPEFVICSPRGDPARTGRLVGRLASKGIRISEADDLDAVLPWAEIIVTVTPSTVPIVRGALIAPGAHVNAMGSDAPGKRELDGDALSKARLIADDLGQVRRFGEAQYLGDEAFASVVTLGSVLNDPVPIRRADEVTVFDSTGLGLHDVLTAHFAYRRALDTHTGTVLHA